MMTAMRILGSLIVQRSLTFLLWYLVCVIQISMRLAGSLGG